MTKYAVLSRVTLQVNDSRWFSLDQSMHYFPPRNTGGCKPALPIFALQDRRLASHQEDPDRFHQDLIPMLVKGLGTTLGKTV